MRCRSRDAGRGRSGASRSMIRGRDLKRRERRDPKERFMEKVDKRPGECWEWLASRYSSGYGMFYYESKLRGAHRVSWLLFHGEIPLGKMVCHTCDNKTCVSPDHLFIGTQTDNMRDSARKGRNGSQTHPEKRPRGDKHWTHMNPERLARGKRSGAATHPETIRKGELNGSAKLTEQQVLEIRDLVSTGVLRKIVAKWYDVTPTTISGITKRKLWKHI